MPEHEMQPQPRQAPAPEAIAGVIDANALRQLLDVELARSRRYGHPFALLRLRVHGADGAAPGASSLRRVAAALRMHTRWADSVGRESADSFLLILRETDADGAERASTKLLASLLQDLRAEAPELQLALDRAAWRRGDDLDALLARLAEGD